MTLIEKSDFGCVPPRPSRHKKTFFFLLCCQNWGVDQLDSKRGEKKKKQVQNDPLTWAKMTKTIFGLGLGVGSEEMGKTF